VQPVELTHEAASKLLYRVIVRGRAERWPCHQVRLRPSATMFCNRGKAFRALKRLPEVRTGPARILPCTYTPRTSTRTRAHTRARSHTHTYAHTRIIAAAAAGAGLTRGGPQAKADQRKAIQLQVILYG
jgi:hypothetical protein